MHWRKSMSERAGLGGLSTDAPAYSADTRADLNSILSSTYTPLPRSQFTQAMLDVATLGVWMLLGLLGVAIVGGPVLVLGWMLFFS
jgi:hypothetical protein